MDLTKLMKPRSMAVVGASEKEGFGGDVCKGLEQDLFCKSKKDYGF